MRRDLQHRHGLQCFRYSGSKPQMKKAVAAAARPRGSVRSARRACHGLRRPRAACRSSYRAGASCSPRRAKLHTLHRHVISARSLPPPARAVADRTALSRRGIRSRALSRDRATSQRACWRCESARAPRPMQQRLVRRRRLCDTEDRRARRDLPRRPRAAGARATRRQVDDAGRLGRRQRHAVARGAEGDRAGVRLHRARPSSSRRSTIATSTTIRRICFTPGRCSSSARSPAASARTSNETDGVEFFPLDALPELSTGRSTAEQIRRMYQHHLDRDLPTEFD